MSMDLTHMHIKHTDIYDEYDAVFLDRRKWCIKLKLKKILFEILRVNALICGRIKY